MEDLLDLATFNAALKKVLEKLQEVRGYNWFSGNSGTCGWDYSERGILVRWEDIEATIEEMKIKTGFIL